MSNGIFERYRRKIFRRSRIMFAVAGMISLFTGSIAAMPLMGMMGGTGSGYVGPAFKLSGVQGEPGMWAGLRGGWVYQHAFSVGLSGYWLLTQVKQSNAEDADLNMGYDGVEFQAFLATEKPYQIAVQTLIGVGSVGDGLHFGGHMFNSHSSSEDTDSFLVVEPGIALQLPLNQYVQWEVSVSYLAMSGLTFDDITAHDLGGFTGTISVNFMRW